MNCGVCNKKTNTNETMSCSACLKYYHFSCVGITDENFKKYSKEYKSAWKCPTCKKPKNKMITAANDELGDASLLLVREDVMSEKIIETIRDEIRRAMREQLSDFTSIKTKVDLIPELKEAVGFISDQYEELKKAIGDYDVTVKQLRSENEELRGTVGELSARLQQLEQHARETNVEVSGLPEDRGEILPALVRQLARAVDHPLPDTDIVMCTRVAKLNKDSGRPRSVVVKLRSVLCRDGLLAAVAKFNKTHPQDKLNSTHVGIGGTKQPVFVSEHLSPANKALHAAARIKAREKNYKFVWVRNGRILVRKDESSPSIAVRSLKSLESM